MDHVAGVVAERRSADAELTAASIMAELRELRGETLAVLSRAKEMQFKPGDCATCEVGPRLALLAVARLEKQSELYGRFLGELQKTTVVHSSIFDAEWLQLRPLLLRSLEPYPEARAALADALAAAGDRLAG
ncbi:MAG TPA: hypothetical protein VE338_06870 [Ktedonobacterales bacterium]|jgi:hypothetical protein|nr:hypothetical protein [Ktedonobacterales bacterium]